MQGMTIDRRRTEHERRAVDRVPAVFAVKKSIAGHVQLQLQRPDRALLQGRIAAAVSSDRSDMARPMPNRRSVGGKVAEPPSQAMR